MLVISPLLPLLNRSSEGYCGAVMLTNINVNLKKANFGLRLS